MPKIKQKLQQAPDLRTQMPVTKMRSELGTPDPPRALTRWVVPACALLLCAVLSGAAFGEVGVVSPCVLSPNTSGIGISGSGQPPYAQPLTLEIRANGIPSPQGLNGQTSSNKIDITVSGQFFGVYSQGGACGSITINPLPRGTYELNLYAAPDGQAPILLARRPVDLSGEDPPPPPAPQLMPLPISPS